MVQLKLSMRLQTYCRLSTGGGGWGGGGSGGANLLAGSFFWGVETSGVTNYSSCGRKDAAKPVLGSLERAKCKRLWHGTHLSSEAHYRPVLAAAAAVAGDEAAAAVNLLQLLLQGGVEGGGRAVNNPRLQDRQVGVGGRGSGRDRIRAKCSVSVIHKKKRKKNQTSTCYQISGCSWASFLIKGCFFVFSSLWAIVRHFLFYLHAAEK